MRVIIRDENDNIKYDESTTLSERSPPNNHGVMDLYYH